MEQKHEEWHWSSIFWRKPLLGSSRGTKDFPRDGHKVPLQGLAQSQALRFLTGDGAGGLLLSALTFLKRTSFYFKNPENESKRLCICFTLTLPHPVLWRYFWCVRALKIIPCSGAGEINVFYYRIGSGFISIHYTPCTAIAGSQLGDEPQPLISSWLEAISSTLYKIPDSSLPLSPSSHLPTRASEVGTK